MFTKTYTFGAEEVKAEIDFDTLPEASKRFIIDYGLKQYLSDGAAVSKDEAETEEARNELKANGIADRITKLREGTVSQRSGNGRTTDPVAKIRRDYAVEIHKLWAKTNDVKPYKGDELVSWIDRFYLKNGDNPKVQAEIDKRIKAMGKMDLGELEF